MPLPIMWRFLLGHYLKVMALCLLTIIFVLLTTRLDEIAHFISLDGSSSLVFLFVLYQIPYLLPIAIPVAALISSILLVQRLSKTHELTAFRACGVGLKELMTPILMAASLLTILNFYVVSELATFSHLNTHLWKNELRSLNPLLMLKNKQLIKSIAGYFDVLGASEAGRFAEHAILAIPNQKTERMILLLIDKALANKDSFLAEGVSIITTEEAEKFDHLFIENINKTTFSAGDFVQLLQKKSFSLGEDHLTMSLLLARIQSKKSLLKNNNLDAEKKKEIKKMLSRSYSEIARRFSAAFAAFSFTFMGLCFGVSVTRYHSNRKMFLVILMAISYIVLFFAAKSLENHWVYASICYFFPHAMILLVSWKMLKRVLIGASR